MTDTVPVDDLQQRYNELLAENRRLREEIQILKKRVCRTADAVPPPLVSIDHNAAPEAGTAVPASSGHVAIHGKSDTADKIRLFLSLFRGREDIHARRWESKSKDRSGYSPFCLHEWKRGVCHKPAVKCAVCEQKAYAPLNEQVVDLHLRGDLVAGIYPLLPDDACCFLAIDFDGDGWRDDVAVLRAVADEYAIPLAIERSRSGNGAHAWFFFDRPLPAVQARRFGSALLTRAMNTRHELPFTSYDRLFPNQDTMPSGGLGNLIALPLQKEARKNGNSEFVDERFASYPDQWAFLASIRRLSEQDIAALSTKLSPVGELGTVRIEDDDENRKPWERRPISLLPADLPRTIEITCANMLYVPKLGMSQRGMNRLKRIAVFKNPEFFRAQAMRLSTFDKPRMICCADETAEYLCLPRGCQSDLASLLSELGVAVVWRDATNHGRPVDVAFSGQLRDDQSKAFDLMLAHECGVLSGTTAFGKTVVAIALIAARKTNTLILVDRASLVEQWKKRLREFLVINEPMPTPKATRGRRKKDTDIIGQLGQGRETLHGIIDIALMQSLCRAGEVRECIKNYGMVIVDECHHVAAFSFEQVLKTAMARYVYGLTATPARKDGHHPVIFMQCGPLRYRDDARKQAAQRPFDHVVVPRFTRMRAPLSASGKEPAIHEWYAEIARNDARNLAIIDDVKQAHAEGRNSLVLTERTAHVEHLAELLREAIPDLLTLVGTMGARESTDVLARIAATPLDRPLVLIATGRYIGEGFDEPRLDTLFLTMPISWKGTLQQYAGRLHRLFEHKKEARIYDYVDIHCRMLEKMYHRRLNGYASIGYKVRAGAVPTDSVDIIFDRDSFPAVFGNDLAAAGREIVIVSPFITRRRLQAMLPLLLAALTNGVRTIVVTRSYDDFTGRDAEAFRGLVDELSGIGVSILHRSRIHQKFAVIDQRVVWYGSINLLSYGSAEESIMRIDSPAIANELMKIVCT